MVLSILDGHRPWSSIELALKGTGAAAGDYALLAVSERMQRT